MLKSYYRPEVVSEEDQSSKICVEPQDRYLALFNSIPLGLYRTTPEGQIVNANNALVEMLGFPDKESLLAYAAFDLYVDPQERQKEKEMLASEEVVRDFEVRLRRLDGKIIWVRDNTHAVKDSEGKILYCDGILEDITAQKQAGEELQRSKAQLAGIINSAMDAIISINADQRIVQFNGAAESMFLCTAAEAIGSSLDRFIPVRFRQHHREHIDNFGKTNISKRSKEKFSRIMGLRSNGEEFPIEASISQIAIGGQKFFTAILRDETNRFQAELQIQSQLERLAALRAIDMTITASLDIRVTFGVLLDQIIHQLGVDAAAVFLYNPTINTLEYAAGRGFRTSAIQHMSYRLGEGLAGRAAMERHTLIAPKAADADKRDGDVRKFSPPLFFQSEGFVSSAAAPLVAKGEVKGVLELFKRAPLEAKPDWRNFLDTLAGQAAIAVDNAELFENLQRSNLELTLAYDTTLEGWSKALELRDHETKGHAHRVTELTVSLARALGVSDEELIHIRRGSLLHDIGKMGIPDRILRKNGQLTEQEWEIMRQHPVHAYELLSPIPYLRKALDIPYCHHERWDGNGYPRGLRGEQIPLAARIFAVVDVWDALLSKRPYRAAWLRADVYRYIQEQSGMHFDPHIVEVFLRMPETNR